MSEPGEPPEVGHGAAPPPPMWTPPPPAMTGQPAAPRPSNAGGVTSIFVVMALLLAATVGSYIYVHNEPTSSSSTVQSVGGGQQVGGSNGTGGGGPPPGQATSSARDPYATPTPPPLDMGAVRRTMAAFLNGLQNHDLEAVRSLVCPKFRSLYVGTYSKAGYSYSGWEAHYSSPVSGLNYTYVVVTQGLADAAGAKKGSETHSWQVEHDGDDYFVCGYLT
ncbi:MAG: hypothetical protein ABI808_14335 [Pseudonocardiales bacterium]